mgnify:CR=1 FL=1
MSFLPDRLSGLPQARVPRPRETNPLSISQRLGIGTNSQFIVLQRGKQKYLLHVSQHGVTEIDRFCDDDHDSDNSEEESDQ